MNMDFVVGTATTLATLTGIEIIGFFGANTLTKSQATLTTVLPRCGRLRDHGRHRVGFSPWRRASRVNAKPLFISLPLLLAKDDQLEYSSPKGMRLCNQ